MIIYSEHSWASVTMMNDIKSDVSNAFQQFIQTNALLLSRVWRNCDEKGSDSVDKIQFSQQ